MFVYTYLIDGAHKYFVHMCNRVIVQCTSAQVLHTPFISPSLCVTLAANWRLGVTPQPDVTSIWPISMSPHEPINLLIKIWNTRSDICCRSICGIFLKRFWSESRMPEMWLRSDSTFTFFWILSLIESFYVSRSNNTFGPVKGMSFWPDLENKLVQNKSSPSSG